MEQDVVPTHPSQTFDYPAASVADLLTPHEALLDRIRIGYGVDASTFEREVMAAVRGYAAFVHLLPATADNHFSTPGGLLELGLEVGFFALQGTNAHIFSGRATISTRRLLEPRWRLATFIAGLCSEAHRALTLLRVSGGAGQSWPCHVTPLAHWLGDEQLDRYRIDWCPGLPVTRAQGLFALRLILQPDLLQHLAQDNTVVVPHLLSSVAGLAPQGPHNVIDDLVRRAAALVIDRHLRDAAARTGQPLRGEHLGRYLVDAMHRLMTTNASWAVNGDRSRVWYASDGLFFVWPGAATDICRLFDADQTPGVPRDPAVMLEALLHDGLLDSRPSGEALWLITPPGSRSAVDAVKWAIPATLFGGLAEMPAPLEAALLAQPAPATAPGAQSSPTAAGGLAIALDAPMRLDRSVRAAIDDFVATLNAEPARLQSYLSATGGVLIPLSEFSARGVLPALALRALSDARMLAATDPSRQHLVDGNPIPGAVVHARHFTGLPLPSAPATPAATGHRS